MDFILRHSKVIWYHNDRPIKESPDFQLLFHGDRCSLLIREAFQEDNGIYSVVAINSAGEASSKCTLTVLRKSHLLYSCVYGYSSFSMQIVLSSVELF